MVDVTREHSEVRYVIEFGDSQRPERFVFNEGEAKLLLKKLQLALYPERYPERTGP